MLHTSIAQLTKRHAQCRFLLDAFELNVESNEAWRLQGKTVLAKALMVAQDNVKMIEMTPAFTQVSQSKSNLQFTALGIKDEAHV
jgi:hypothetical protein